MNISLKTPAILASASLVVLCTALFVPLFAKVVLWFVVTVSVWQISPSVAFLCATIIAAIILAPLFRSNTRIWLVPVLFGIALLMAVLSAVVYMFVIADLNGLLFHQDAMILLSIGALLCTIEGLVLKFQNKLSIAA